MAAAKRVRETVERQELGALAWPYRGLAMLGGMKGAQLAHSAAATVLAVAFPPVGAAVGAHVAISGAVAKQTAAGFQRDAKRELAKAKKAHNVDTAVGSRCKQRRLVLRGGLLLLGVEEAVVAFEVNVDFGR